MGLEKVGIKLVVTDMSCLKALTSLARDGISVTKR